MWNVPTINSLQTTIIQTHILHLNGMGECSLSIELETFETEKISCLNLTFDFFELF